MLHDLALAAVGDPSTVPDGGSTIALFGLIGTIVVTVGAIVVARIQRGKAATTLPAPAPQPVTVDQQYIQDLKNQRNRAVRDKEAAESQCDQTTAENRLLRRGISQLREAMIAYPPMTPTGTITPDSVLTNDVKQIL